MSKSTFHSFPRLLVVLVGALTALASCQTQYIGTVLLVRHAEKAAAPPGDPPLTPAGQARAQQLAQVCGKAGVSAIYATSYLRTQETVAPVAAALDLTVSIEDDLDALVADINANHTGEVVLVAGHSNTVPNLIAKLGGPMAGHLTEYDDLFVVTRTRCSCGSWGHTEVVTLNLQYGTPDP